MDDSDGLFPEDGREMPIKKGKGKTKREKGKEEEKERERGFCKKICVVSFTKSASRHGLFYFLMVGLGA